MATYKRNRSGGSQSEGASNSASPASSVALSNPSSSQGINNNAPKYGTLVPNRIFVGGISSNTTEAELSQLFSKYGNVKATKIIADRAGVSKGYGFVTFESEEEVKFLIQDANNIVLKERRLNIAPAIKKQPFSRSFDASSPPPTTPNLYFHNGVPYTFHNGMAFFPPTAHQPALAALPPSADPSMYPSYGPTQNAAPAPYAPVLVPAAPPPVFMPQNYSYQPMPMTNGTATQFIYTGSASPNSSSGSPMASTPENPHLPAPLPPHFYTQQFTTHESFYPPPYYFSYTYSAGEYDGQDQQNTNDDCSSTVSTPHSDTSERSSNRSPASLPPTQPSRPHYVMIKSKVEHSVDVSNSNKGPVTQHQPPVDSQVPVVSWQKLKNQGDERELHISGGRRAFHPIVPPPPPPPPPQPPQVLLYQQHSFPSTNYQNNNYQQPKPSQLSDSSRGQRQNSRGRSRYIVSANSVPFIPKFPASFNNNNPLATNNNFHDKKPSDVNNGRPQRNSNNHRGRGGSRGAPPPPSKPKPSNSYVSSPSPQMLQAGPAQQYSAVDRSVMVSNTSQRWPSVTSHQIKRLVCSKRQNGSTSNMGGSGRMSKNAIESVEADTGGGGDAQPILQLAMTPPASPSASATNPEITSKMQSLSLGSSS